MKKMYLVHLKEDLATAFSKWTFEKGVIVQLSYLKDFLWDGTRVIAYCIVPEDQCALFEAEYNNYIKN